MKEVDEPAKQYGFALPLDANTDPRPVGVNTPEISLESTIYYTSNPMIGIV